MTRLPFLTELIYLITWIYFIATSIVLYEFMVRPDEENWLLPMQLFLKITFEGLLYMAAIIFIGYRIYKKTRAKGILSFIPFR